MLANDYIVKILKARGTNVLANPRGIYSNADGVLDIIRLMEEGDVVSIEKIDVNRAKKEREL